MLPNSRQLYLDEFDLIIRFFRMHAILQSLAPVFLLIALGASLQWGRFFADGVIPGANRLVYWVGLPPVIFLGLATADASEVEMGALTAAFFLATVGVMGAAWATSRLSGLPTESRGTFAQASFRGNLAFVALPVVLAVPGASHTAAALLLGPAMVLYNLVSVAWLLASNRKSHDRGYARQVTVEILRNPLVLATVAGGLVLMLGWECPPVLTSTLRHLGAMVVPLALICVGSVLISLPVRGALARVGLATALKTGLAPLLGWLAGTAFGLGHAEMTTLLIFMAAPTAVISHTIVRQLGGDEPLAAGAVVMSTLISALSLAVVVGLHA